MMNKHVCLVDSETATAGEMSMCYLRRPHMEKYCGVMTLRRPDGTRLYVDISKADLDHP